MATAKIKTAVIISDLHCGSTVGLLPPAFVTEDGNEISQNTLQKWLWECWIYAHDYKTKLLGKDPHCLIVNGDCVEGNHHRTIEIVAANEGEHVRIAEQCLANVCSQAAKSYFVKGTECHVKGVETFLAKTCKAEKNPETQIPIFDRLDLNIMGNLMSVRHHFPATSRSYLEASQHSIQIGNAVNEAVRAGDQAPTILVGAHRHRTGHYCDGNRLTVVTGAWQGLTRFGYKVVPDGRPCPSIYILDWRNRKEGELPEVHFRAFNPPKAKIVQC